MENFDVGFFELLLHELLRLHGYEIVPHPTIAGTKKRPDYLVKTKDVEFVLEARIVTDISAEMRAEIAIKQNLYQHIDSVDSPNFFLALKQIQIPNKKQPSAKRFRSFLKRCINNTDYDELSEQMKSNPESMPIHEFNDNEIKIHIMLIPKSDKIRGKKGVRPIGLYPVETRIGGSASAIKEAILEKAGRYGKMGLPYIIALNSISGWGTDREDILEALFGPEEIHFDPITGNVLNVSRKNDGAFYGPKGFQCTRVSGVLIGTVFPASIPKQLFTLYHHPVAAHPFNSHLLNVEHAIVKDGGLEIVKGPSLNELFKLPQNWPDN